ncbi:glycoside hydrolase superfamily [Mariannaea sp. PMI_226]|nr:glycoside hydrolase superfamily [Mariannaea sp. PMI_226]
MRVSSTIAAGALVAGASAKNYLGFNSGATLADRSAKFKADFKAEFETAQNLKGSPGDFNAVRLYTNIQAYSKNDPIQAFEAAIDTDTSILLGVWTSGTDNIDEEITALKTAVSKYGKSFTDLVIGISIGSEDLYRNSVTGVENKGGIGANPDVIVNFINDFKKEFAHTGLASIPVGHVDTWDAWQNGSNKAVIDAVDWLGVDEYPYYENGKGNNIDNAGNLFDKAFDITVAAAGGKPVWVTETGWPYIGPDWDEGVPSVANAKKYWQHIGCKRLFHQVPTFWYTLRDSNPDNKMKFGITDNLSTTPRFDLSCPAHIDEPTSTSAGGSKPTGTKGSDSTETKDSDSTETSASKPTGTESGSKSSSSSESSSTPSTVGSSASAIQMFSVGSIVALVAAIVL